jgi:hypothetical protein
MSQSMPQDLPAPGAPHGAAQRRMAPTQQQAIVRFMRSRNELSDRQRAAVELVLRGQSDIQVGAELGVDRGTVLRWRKCLAFARELDRQRSLRIERATDQLHALLTTAFDILQKEAASDDSRARMRAVAAILRFATPTRLAMPSAAEEVEAQERRHGDDLIAYVDAPLPGQPGAPETMADDADEVE